MWTSFSGLVMTEICLHWVVHNLQFHVILTHWGWVTHIYVSDLTIIGSDSGLSPGRCQSIISINGEIQFIWPWGTGLCSIPFFQFNSNSNSVIFNYNLNSNPTTHKFESNLSSRNDLLNSSTKLIIIIITMHMWRYMKLLLSIVPVSYLLLNGYNYIITWHQCWSYTDRLVQ